MKRRNKTELYIPLTQEPEKGLPGRKLLRYLIPALFAAAVVASVFFVDGSLLPGEEEPSYKVTKEVILPMARVSSLNPLASRDEDTYYISKLIYDSLFEMDKTMAPVANLAASYKFDRSNAALVVNLRKDVQWQDGKKLNAKDVAYSFEIIRRAGRDSLYTAAASAIESIEVLGTYKIRVNFADGNEMGLDLLTFPILPDQQYDSASAAVSAGEAFKPLGTGPYAFKRYDPTTEMVLVPNESYGGEVPDNRLVFRILPQQSNLYNLLKASSLSLIISRSADRETRISGSDVTVVDFPQDKLEMIGFNMNGPATQKRSIRKAIACAVDVQRIIDECYYGSGIPSGGLFYPAYLGTGGNTELYAYSRENAKGYLEASGLTDKDGDGYVELPDQTPLELQFLVNDDRGSRVAAAKQIAAELKKIGLDTNLQILPWEAYVQALETGAFDLYMGGIKVTPAMDFRPWLTAGGSYNFTGYQNGKLSDLLDQFRSGLDVEGLGTVYAQIRDILDGDLPCYGLFYKTSGAILSPALQGEVTPLFTDYYRNSGGWICRYEVAPGTEGDE